MPRDRTSTATDAPAARLVTIAPDPALLARLRASGPGSAERINAFVATLFADLIPETPPLRRTAP